MCSIFYTLGRQFLGVANVRSRTGLFRRIDTYSCLFGAVFFNPVKEKDIRKPPSLRINLFYFTDGVRGSENEKYSEIDRCAIFTIFQCVRTYGSANKLMKVVVVRLFFANFDRH